MTTDRTAHALDTSSHPSVIPSLMEKKTSASIDQSSLPSSPIRAFPLQPPQPQPANRTPPIPTLATASAPAAYSILSANDGDLIDAQSPLSTSSSSSCAPALTDLDPDWSKAPGTIEYSKRLILPSLVTQQQQQRRRSYSFVQPDSKTKEYLGTPDYSGDDDNDDGVDSVLRGGPGNHLLRAAATTANMARSHSGSDFDGASAANQDDMDIGSSFTSTTHRLRKAPSTSGSSSVSGMHRTRTISGSGGARTSIGVHLLNDSSDVGVAGTGAGLIEGGGTLSPAWSMSSIPRDISSTYNYNGNNNGSISHGSLNHGNGRTVPDQVTPLTVTPVDERLYALVDRYGFLVEEGRTPSSDRHGNGSNTSSNIPNGQGRSNNNNNNNINDNSNGNNMYSSNYRSPSTLSLAARRERTKAIKKEQQRSQKWTKMAKQYTSDNQETEYTFPNNSKFTSRVHKGIPDCWRAAAWSYLINKKAEGFDPNIRQIYHEMLEIASPEEEQIDLDIPRTMHGHIMFRARYGPGQCALFSVLKAYSNYNRRVGYCQGMASVVATMLTFFDEEKTFVLLAQLFERYNIRDLVVPGFPGLFEAFYIQEELTKIYAPKVRQALDVMGIATASFASRWYITLYSGGVVPHRTLLRIWDIFLLEGFDWLYFMALALLKYHEPMLLQLNFERTMEMLNAKMDIQDDNRLIQIAQKISKQARQSRIVSKLKRRYNAIQKQTVDAKSG